MAKYRKLTSEELKNFEKEFIEYLVINGIDAQTWELMKEGNPGGAQKIIELFSDVVFEKILRNSKYISQSVKNQMYCFYFGEEKAELMVINYLGESDFEKLDYITMKDELADQSHMFKINYQTKTYNLSREKEMFDLIQAGCDINSGEIFKMLKEYYLKQSN